MFDKQKIKYYFSNLIGLAYDECEKKLNRNDGFGGVEELTKYYYTLYLVVDSNNVLKLKKYKNGYTFNKEERQNIIKFYEAKPINYWINEKNEINNMESKKIRKITKNIINNSKK